MGIDYEKMSGDIVNVLKEEVSGFLGDSKLDARLLAELGRDAAQYWAKAILGDGTAEVELEHIRATSLLVTAKLSLVAQQRMEQTLNVILKTGLIALKAIL